jgi:hypothetical protein
MVHPCTLGVRDRWQKACPAVWAPTRFGAQLQVFADPHGFLLIIRGFVKVSVFNAGGIQT